MLIADSLSKHYPSRGEPLEVLRSVSLQMDRGQSLAIVGPSGTGKSTLLHLIGTLDAPTSGTITLDGVNPYELSEAALARFRNQRIGFIFQDHHLLPQLTILENVLVPALAAGRPSEAAVDRAGDLIERVGLASRIDHLPSELSGGERERVAVARALLNQPSLVLADEPTGNLDRKNAERIAELLVELHKEQNNILITVTHSASLAQRMDQRKGLEEGQLVDAP
jgi:lipoprotein-releasing system ATP-binding protein